jgi:hypothetical protein
MILSTAGNDVLTGKPATAARLIQAQSDPVREGQRIVISGSASNDGTFRVAQVRDPSSTGAGAWNIFVEEALVFEIVGPGVSIRTHIDDRQFSYDLDTSTAVILSNEQAGAFGIDVSGGDQASYLASEAFAVVSDGAVNTDGLLWDPPLAIGHLINNSTTRKGVLDAIALSAMSWWVEDEEGVFRLITIRPPVGAPARRFRSEILTIRSLASTDPFSRISVGHSRNYLVLDQGNIPGSVPANTRARLSSEYLYVPRNATAATLKNFPQSKPRPDAFPTYLGSDADAQQWLDFAAPMFLEERSWWEVTLAGAWIAAVVRAGDEHEFVYDPPTGKFEAGAAARIMNVSVEKGADRTILEVIT